MTQSGHSQSTAMDTDKLNKWLSLGANIGVVAGIVFLAVELQQNNEILEAQARRDQFEFRSEAGAMLIANPDLAEIVYKARNGDELSPSESFMFDRWTYQIFRAWEWQFNEYLEGTLTEDELPTVGWANQFKSYAVMRSNWDARKANLSPEFVQYIENNVIGH